MKGKKHSISRINLLKTLDQTATHIPILSSNLLTPYTHRNTGNTHRAHMGDIKKKEIKFELKRSNLVGDFEINKKILEEDIKLKQIKFGPHKVTT